MECTSSAHLDVERDSNVAPTGIRSHSTLLGFSLGIYGCVCVFLFSHSNVSITLPGPGVTAVCLVTMAALPGEILRPASRAPVLGPHPATSQFPPHTHPAAFFYLEQRVTVPVPCDAHLFT